MPVKKFLEEYPLYKKFITDFRSFHDLNDLPKPAIHMTCGFCNSDQTFNMSNEYYEVDYNSNTRIPNIVVRVKYLCTACQRFSRFFLINFGEGTIKRKNDQDVEEAVEVIYIQKVGQFPSWNIEMDKNLEEILGDHAEYYRRGLICESQSYGIGAYAYFRRITENIIDQLLDSISDLLDGEEKRKYGEALVKTKQTKITQDKIDLVKDLLPVSLRPNGINPLEALHSALSQGLHEEDDEICLEYADAIREVLIYLVNQIIRKKEDSKKFTDGMKRLLDKKTQNGLVKK